MLKTFRLLMLWFQDRLDPSGVLQLLDRPPKQFLDVDEQVVLLSVDLADFAAADLNLSPYRVKH